jgi:hypothetical protein
MRLAARIADLKEDGHNIKTSILRSSASGKVYAVYSLEDDVA